MVRQNRTGAGHERRCCGCGQNQALTVTRWSPTAARSRPAPPSSAPAALESRWVQGERFSRFGRMVSTASTPPASRSSSCSPAHGEGRPSRPPLTEPVVFLLLPSLIPGAGLVPDDHPGAGQEHRAPRREHQQDRAASRPRRIRPCRREPGDRWWGSRGRLGRVSHGGRCGWRRRVLGVTDVEPGITRLAWIAGLLDRAETGNALRSKELL
jgi:hypothetical protein